MLLALAVVAAVVQAAAAALAPTQHRLLPRQLALSCPAVLLLPLLCLSVS
jgi:hypothetical protein